VFFEALKERLVACLVCAGLIQNDYVEIAECLPVLAKRFSHKPLDTVSTNG